MNIKIEFHGDSTQLGASVWGGTVYFASVPPAKYAQMALRDIYEDVDVSVENFGVGGSTAIDALNTALYSSGTFSEHIQQSDAHIVVANWGINDNFIAGHTANAHAANFQALRQIAESAGKIFIAETTNPVSYQWPERDASLASFNAAVKSLPGINIADQHCQITQYYPLWAHHMSDGVHPNNIIYTFKGHVLFNVLRGHVASIIDDKYWS